MIQRLAQASRRSWQLRCFVNTYPGILAPFAYTSCPHINGLLTKERGGFWLTLSKIVLTVEYEEKIPFQKFALVLSNLQKSKWRTIYLVSNERQTILLDLNKL